MMARRFRRPVVVSLQVEVRMRTGSSRKWAAPALGGVLAVEVVQGDEERDAHDGDQQQLLPRHVGHLGVDRAPGRSLQPQ